MDYLAGAVAVSKVSKHDLCEIANQGYDDSTGLLYPLRTYQRCFPGAGRCESSLDRW